MIFLLSRKRCRDERMDLGGLLLVANLAALAHGLVLGTEGGGLLGEVLGTDLLGLGLVDVFHQDTLVLEAVTLGLEVQVVVQVLVDLASLTVLAEKTAENAHAAHPEGLLAHTSIGSTLALTMAHVATEALGLEALTETLARSTNLGLADDQTILDQLADVGA